MVAEFSYRPTVCNRTRRVIRLSKPLATDEGQVRLFERYRYSFIITNDRTMPAEAIVLSAKGRCDQENPIAQFEAGVRALTVPVEDLMSTWAYMVMASLARGLKSWAALLVPDAPRHASKLRTE
jgi:hypothetical protein